MNKKIIIARKMVRLAILTRDALMWESAHKLFREAIR